MAFIINSLLTSECIFRIFTCLVAEPIKMAFLFLGWMPPFLLKISMAIEERINGLNESANLQYDEFVVEDNKNVCKTDSERDSQWFCFTTSPGSNFTKVPFKHMEAMCFLPTCISQFGTAGTCIFIMLISIVR